ncbi:MAG TPA: hypothetical protein VFZ24_13995 [Longimicrobiales bacterium]
MNGRGASGARLIAVAALLLCSAGCARLFGTYDFAPSGLASGEDRLRHMLATGQATDAFTAFGNSFDPPEDEVLRALYQGILAYYAGAWDESARVLDIAAARADERYTKSISRAALSVITNDLILPYEPGRTERLMIPYYGALARMRLGDVEGAAVEARRLSMLLQLYADDEDVVEPAIEATLRYVAGVVFEAHGDRNDADVAYRNAAALDSTLARPNAAAPLGLGTAVIVLEQGFVAHRVEQGLAVLLLPEEVDLITNGDGDERSAALGFVAARTLRQALRAPYSADGPYRRTTLHVAAPEDRSQLPRRRRRIVCRPTDDAASGADSTRTTTPRQTSGGKEECREEEVEIDEMPYLLKVAWPVYRTDARPLDARLITPADTVDFLGRADLSRGVVDDFNAERGLLVARTIARGAAKLALTKGAENKLEEKNEAAAKIVGLLGNLGNVLLERADTRSWHLLPAGVSVARVNLPPGEHRLSVAVGARTVELEPVRVKAGGLSVVAARVW